MLPPVELFDWSWHHFRPFNEPENYLPVLRVFAKYDEIAIAECRKQIGLETEALHLDVALGARKGETPDPIRDRFDIWRFTGAIYEPGLFEECIKLTPLGLAIAEGDVEFNEAMHRQALRLRFPYLRMRRESEVDAVSDQLHDALDHGNGVNVAEAWSAAMRHLSANGEDSLITGEEAMRFLSGSASIEEIPERTEALAKARHGYPQPFAEISKDTQRQGRELKEWLDRNRAVLTGGEWPPPDLPTDAHFEFKSGKTSEVIRWNRWWGELDQSAKTTTPVVPPPALPELSAGESDDPLILVLDQTEGQAVTSIRLEQRGLRKALFGSSKTGTCDLCGRLLPVDSLRAAHIKKRSKCSTTEKLDTANVMSACTLGCDHFFELGYIIVNSEGEIESNEEKHLSADMKEAIEALTGSRCLRFMDANRDYFAFHRDLHGQQAT